MTPKTNKMKSKIVLEAEMKLEDNLAREHMMRLERRVDALKKQEKEIKAWLREMKKEIKECQKRLNKLNSQNTVNKNNQHQSDTMELGKLQTSREGATPSNVDTSKSKENKQ